MIDEKQRHILEAVVQVLAVAGIQPWFEARLIKDSDKKLNGKRISSKTKTDLASVLKVADEKRVNMLPNYRMELRMYATVGKSRSVFMGEEQDPFTPDAPDEVRELPKGKPIELKLPVLGVINVDNPGDPRHKGLLTGRANYSPGKNVERLRQEGLAEDDPLMVQAKNKVAGRFYDPGPPNLDDPHTDVTEVPTHICDANGPMRQQESDGPFLTTCSLCGEFNAGQT